MAKTVARRVAAAFWRSSAVGHGDSSSSSRRAWGHCFDPFRDVSTRNHVATQSTDVNACGLRLLKRYRPVLFACRVEDLGCGPAFWGEDHGSAWTTRCGGN